MSTNIDAQAGREPHLFYGDAEVGPVIAAFLRPLEFTAIDGVPRARLTRRSKRCSGTKCVAKKSTYRLCGVCALAARIDWADLIASVPRTGDVGDWHVDRAQVHRGVVADRAGQAKVPGPIVISESSQHSDQSLSVNKVEPENLPTPGVKPVLGRTGQSVAQPIEHGPR